ncbi:hypothetical protein [Nocardia sp. NPDC046763]|uniref:hypothetical protein n=1 Tax=Nocardia sp. NPDC046763 TaxID=3155256 RepID=UPI0034091802
MYWTWGRRLIAAAAATLIGLAIAACGSTESTGGQSKASAAATSTKTTPTEAPSGQIGRAFTADPSIVSPHGISFDSWTRVAPDRIAVNFQTGSPECYGVNATVTETETSSTVTVDLKSGTLPDAVGKMCTMIAVFGTLEIQLKSPLGDRKVLSAN